MHPSLETARLRLRPFVEADLDSFARLCADPEVMRYIGAGNPLSRSQAWRAMALFRGHWELRGYGMWAAEDKQTDRFVGRIGLHNPEGWPGLEVGWVLGREWWQQGLATEGGRAAIQFAFDQMRVDHLISLIHPLNRASARVAEKLGLRLERTIDLGQGNELVYGRGPHSEAAS